jgi:hypothetical protein
MNLESIKKFILQLDLLGPTPSLTIFNNNNYKSFKSAIISLLGILAIIAFSLYSIIDFFKFDNPTIIYLKENSQTNNITLNLNDILFMFQINYNTSLNLNYKLEGLLIDGNSYEKEINIEKCSLSQNMDIKYKESILEFLSSTKQNLTDYFCINENDNNFTIFNNKLKRETYIMILVKSPLSQSNSRPENGEYLRYIVRSDSIDHFDRKQPLKLDFDTGESELSKSSIIYTTILLNYLEYETDNGIFFSNSEKYNGIEFFNQGDKMPRNYANFIKNRQQGIKISFLPDIIGYSDNSYSDFEKIIGILFLRINGRSLERYKRTYPKLQSLIADIISTIQFVLLIYESLTNNLYSNKIGVEIIKNILSKDYDDRIKINIKDKKEEDNKNVPNKFGQYKLSSFQYNKFVEYNTKNLKENSKFEGILFKKDNKSSAIKYLPEITKSDTSMNRNLNKGKIKINIKTYNNLNWLEKMNKINFWNYLFYDFSCCFLKENKKNKIIEKCKELIDKESSINNIIYKMLKLENKNEQKISENNKIKEIINLLKEI